MAPQAPVRPDEDAAAAKEAADKAAAEEAARKKSDKATKKVKYVGTSDERHISKADFASLGIEQGAVKFSRANNWSMTNAEGALSDDALEYFDTADDGFVVTDVE